MTSNAAMTEDENFVSDIIGVNTYALETRKKKDFLPWHKPRKQFVRHRQWVEQINKMVNEIMPENNILKYLGLPGDDLLDLRYFHDHVCKPNNLQLKFLGFNHGANPNSKHSAELNISLDEISKLRLVDPSSEVIGDDICRIANSDSLASNRAMKMGPYDVINIDLCDGFGKHPPDQFEENHYNTLLKLMTLQARRRDPWLLLLTTRTGPEHINVTILDRLKSLYSDNLDNEPFRVLSNSTFTITDTASLEAFCTTKLGTSNVFLVALCKWIASIIVIQNPPSKMEVKSVIGYKVDPGAEHQDLVSLAIRIEPTLAFLPDRIGLATQEQLLPDEAVMALQALDRVSKLKDVDQILSDNVTLKDEMISMSVTLLEEARYDVTEYAAWANS